METVSPMTLTSSGRRRGTASTSAAPTAGSTTSVVRSGKPMVRYLCRPEHHVGEDGHGPRGHAEGVVAHEARLEAPQAGAAPSHQVGGAVDGAVDDLEVEEVGAPRREQAHGPVH